MSWFEEKIFILDNIENKTKHFNSIIAIFKIVFCYFFYNKAV